MKHEVVPIWIVTGPTATGKTFAAIESAEKLKKKGISSEIINSDSVQLYKDLKILTAFPSSEQMSRVPHHLYGILDADEKISVANWKILAESKIEELRKKKIVPIICGGTGFYVNAIINGISNIPEIPDRHRKEVFEKFLTQGREKFFEELSLLDPEAHLTLHPNNTQRILRAYEVASFTGKPLSFWWRQGKKQNCKNIRTVVIIPDKDSRNKSILDRAYEMAKSGVVKEVENFLKSQPNYDGPLSNAIGFKEIKAFLNGEIPEEELIERIFIKTRRYVKRQITWFKHQMGDAIFTESPDQVTQILCENL